MGGQGYGGGGLGEEEAELLGDVIAGEGGADDALF